MKPWARVPGREGVRRGGAAAARATAPAGRTSTRSRGPTGTPRPSARSTGSARDDRRRRGRRRCRWAARWRCGSPRSAPDGRRRHRPGQPVRVQHDRKELLALPRAQARGAVDQGRRQRHQEARPGRGRLHRLPLQGPAAVVEHVAGRWCPTCRKVTAAAALLPVRRSTTSSTPSSSADRPGRRRLAATSRSGCSTDSYHVATLDNDADADLRGVRRVRRGSPLAVPA